MPGPMRGHGKNVAPEKAKDAKTDAINKRKKQESKKRSFLTCKHHRRSAPTLSARKYATAPSTDWGSFSASPAWRFWSACRQNTATFGPSPPPPCSAFR